MNDSDRKELTLPTIGKVAVNFFGLSYKIVCLYENVGEFERQKGIKHLGLISSVFDGATHSRYEYAMLQSCICDLFNNIYKGTATAA